MGQERKRKGQAFAKNSLVEQQGSPRGLPLLRKECGTGETYHGSSGPFKQGGRSTKGNIVAACKECNTNKKYLLPVEWDQYLNSLSEKPTDLI